MAITGTSALMKRVLENLRNFWFVAPSQQQNIQHFNFMLPLQVLHVSTPMEARNAWEACMEKIYA